MSTECSRFPGPSFGAVAGEKFWETCSCRFSVCLRPFAFARFCVCYFLFGIFASELLLIFAFDFDPLLAFALELLALQATSCVVPACGELRQLEVWSEALPAAMSSRLRGRRRLRRSPQKWRESCLYRTSRKSSRPWITTCATLAKSFLSLLLRRFRDPPGRPWANCCAQFSAMRSWKGLNNFQMLSSF